MTNYSLKIGFLKSLKNVAITVGVPALIVLLNSYLEWMPKEWYTVAVPVIEPGNISGRTVMVISLL